MVGAERMKIAGELAVKKGDAADNMQVVFQDKQNAICGGMEIRDELIKGTSVGGMRTTNWDKVIKIADAYLENVEIEIPILTKAVKELEKRLALAGADDAFTDKTVEDIVPVIMKTISKPNTFFALDKAKASECGMKPNAVNTPDVKRENRKRIREASRSGSEPDLLPTLDLNCFDNGIEEWNTDLAEFLSEGKVRANSDNTFKACCDVLECGADSGKDLTMSYCDEFCTRISNHPSLNAVEYMGGKTKELQEELDQKSAELKTLMSEQKECEAAKIALTDFQKQMDGLNAEIEDTFEKHKAANRAVEAAENGLDKMEAKQGDLTAKLEALEEKLAEKGKIEEGLKADMAAIKKQEPIMRAAVAAAIASFEAATSKLDDAMGALMSFDNLKILVGGTVSQMWAYFNAGVLEHMNELGIEKGYDLNEYFNENYPQSDVYIPFVKGLKELSGFCEKTAVPAFNRVEDPKDFPLKKTLNNMCEYDPYSDAAAAFGEEVMGIKAKMLESLESAQTWHEPSHGHPEYTPEFLQELVASGEIALLRDIENAFSPSDYYANYLSQWKKGGPFLALLAELKRVEANLNELKDQLDKKVKTGKDMLETLLEKKKQTMLALTKAAQETADSAQAVTLAKGEQDALQAEIEAAEENWQELMDLLAKAEAAWMAARAAFAEAHKRGTNL